MKKTILTSLIILTFISCKSINIGDTKSSICDKGLSSSSVGFQDGSGSLLEPYIICSAEQFNLIGSNPNLTNKHFSVAKDINFAGLSYNLIADTGGGEFSGSIDGNNHSILNLTISRPTEDFVALVRSSTGAIRNLHLRNVHITGKSYVGGIVAENFGIIENVSVEGIVVGSAYAIGGVLGYSLGSVAKSYSNNLIISGNEGVGVFIGVNEGNIIDSYAIGEIDCITVACDGDVYGGFVGYMEAGDISNSYCVSNLEAVTPTLGYGFGSYFAGTESNNFWNMDLYSTSEVSMGTSVNSSQMKTKGTFTSSGWDFVNLWQIDSSKNNGYPTIRK
jgi:hypothetical protein